MSSPVPISDDDNSPRLWFLRTTGLFLDQSESILSWAGDESRERVFDKGDVLPTTNGEQRTIYVLLDGKVKLRSVAENGKERILDVAGPGDTFGPIECVLTDGPATPNTEFAAEAVALSPGAAMAYDSEDFKRLLARRPNVVINLSRLLGLKQRQLEVRLSRLLFRSSLGKVAGLIAELADRYGEQGPEGLELGVRLTHQEMASMIGLKRETVSECMAALELEEIIRTNKRRVFVVKQQALDRVV